MGNTPKNQTNSNSIDEELYSRQIICLGFDTMKKISNLKILIIGLRGLGVEIAKNLIVSGPKSVTIFDKDKVEINDLGSNFYLTEKDIGKRRDESCINKLKKLNKYVKVNYLKEKELSQIYNKLAGNYNVIVISEMLSEKDLLQIDNISRSNKICLIYSVICGLFSFVFTDFGQEFTIYDEYCIKKRKFYIKNIQKSKEGLVEIQWNGERNPYIQEYILFKDIEGMTELNYDEKKKNIYKITSKDARSFYIGDTSNFKEYISGGYIEETTFPKKMNYKSFQETLNEPFSGDNHYKNFKKKFIFLVFKALMIFFGRKNRLPLREEPKEYDELKLITKTLFDNLDYEKSHSFQKDEIVFDEQLIKNIYLSSRAEIPCMTSFIGGIVSQEILKTTGKFIPINQWEIFNFSQYSSIIPEKHKNFKDNFIRKKTRYDDIISVFGEKIFSIIQSLNIFLAGSGAVGCEVLKNLALLGISSGLVVDDDNIEISNLNRQFLFHEEHKGKSKALVAANSAKEINPNCKFDYISKRISPENKYIFNSSYFNKVDFVFGAIDSFQGNYYLVRQCELFNKIFIKGATGGPCGKSQIFIPEKTCSYNDIPSGPDEEDEEKLPSCTRREFPGKIEDCLDYARDLFDEYYFTIIDDILKLFDPQEKFLQDEVKGSLNKFNIINKYFYFIQLENNRKKNEINNQVIKNKKFNIFKVKANDRITNNEKEFIKFGLMEFEILFVNNIKNIYLSHPLNEKEESKIFWMNKRKPSELPFNINDELSLSFLFYFLYICSSLLKIPFENNISKFKEKVIEVINDINANENHEAKLNFINDPEILYNKIKSEIKLFQKDNELYKAIKNLQKINFQKDISELGHIQFIYTYSNLKAKSYKIPGCDKFYALEYVGKIAPTTITSTAVVSGLMCLQMIGLIINKLYIWPINKILGNDDYDEEELNETGLHNFCIDLKQNEYDFEMLSDIKYIGVWDKNEIIPNKYNAWYKITERRKNTIKDFIEYIKEKYGVNVTLILSAEDDRDLYEKIPDKKKTKKALEKKKLMESRLNESLEDVYFNTAKNICNEYIKEKELFLKIKGLDDNGIYIEIPVIKYLI